MKSNQHHLHKFQSLSEFHKMFGLPKPEHPLVSFIRLEDMTLPEELAEHMVLDFYKIAYKDTIGSARYGQHHYDFGEGGLVFTAPGQLFEKPKNNKSKGFLILLHPDFLLSYPLAKKIRQYGFFSYSADEALKVSESEKNTLFSVFSIIEEELKSRMDDFSQDVVISQLELLLNYSSRYYKRQFITYKAVNDHLIEKFEKVQDKQDSSKEFEVIPTQMKRFQRIRKHTIKFERVQEISKSFRKESKGAKRIRKDSKESSRRFERI